MKRLKHQNPECDTQRKFEERRERNRKRERRAKGRAAVVDTFTNSGFIHTQWMHFLQTLASALTWKHLATTWLLCWKLVHGQGGDLWPQSWSGSHCGVIGAFWHGWSQVSIWEKCRLGWWWRDVTCLVTTASCALKLVIRWYKGSNNVRLRREVGIKTWWPDKNAVSVPLLCSVWCRWKWCRSVCHNNISPAYGGANIFICS